MNNVVSQDVREILLEQNIGQPDTNSDWAVYIGAEPDGNDVQDAVITIYDTGGEPKNPKFLVDYPTFQTRVRGNNYQYLKAAEKLQEIVDTLLGFTSIDYNGSFYSGIWTTSDIISLGRSENRPILVCNWRAIRFPSEGKNRQSL